MLDLNSLPAFGESTFRPSFFAKPPFRSYFFVGDTLLLIVALSILAFVLASYWSRLQAISVFWLWLVGFSMIAIWALALRCYLRIHELFQKGTESSVSDSSPLGIAMASAAGMIYLGLFFAYFMTVGVLMLLSRSLSGH